MAKSLLKTMFISSKRSFVSVVAAIIFASLCVSGVISHEEEDPLESITKAELRDQIFFLASDELEGRDTGSEGFALAALYAVSQFKMSGLKPLIVDEDGNKNFYQSVPFVSYDINNKSVFSISSGAGETKLFHSEKMMIYSNPSVGKNIFLDENPVFLGYGIDDPEIGWSDYEGVDVKGKVVFFYGGAPSKDGKPFFSPEKDKFYRQFGLSANARIVNALKYGASAVIFVPEPSMAKHWANITSSMMEKQFAVQLKGNKRPDFPALFFMHPDAVSAMLQNAGYEWAYGDYDYKPGVLDSIKVSCSVEKENEEKIICKNVVALLPGTDPLLKDEYIVLHAHLDHLGVNSSGQVMNGADDNASGCAVVLEIAEALAMKPTKRSFIFVLFTGEEKGTLGSEWFMDNLPVPREKIVLNAAIDMIGRKSNGLPDVIFIAADGPAKDSLLDIANLANESRIHAEVDFSLNESDLDGHILRCDLRPFLLKNITSLLFTRGFMSPVYHHPKDDADTLNYDKIVKASRLLYLILEEEGNRD